MFWKYTHWKLAGLVLIVAAIGSAIWYVSASDQDEDDDENKAPARTSVAPEVAVPAQAPGTSLAYNFDSDAAGKLPNHFHQALTGGGGAVNWVVQQDDSARSKPNVLTQTSTDKTDYRFPLAIADDGSFRDLDLSVKFKAIAGSVDRAGGLVFRLEDANNYYVVRANALEDNFNLYYVLRGTRRQIQGTHLKVSSGEWHELRVEAAGEKIRCYFDGERKIEANDDTFKNAGKIGLWTKADSVTSFDDLKVVAK